MMIASTGQKLIAKTLQQCMKSKRNNWQVRAVPKISEHVEKWNKAVIDATELIPKSKHVFDLNGVFSKFDEISKLLRKVEGTSHPLIQEYKNLFSNSRSSFQITSLIALLVAKAAGYQQNLSQTEKDMITEQQQKWMNAIELTYAEFVSHKSILNLNTSKDGDIKKSLQFTNAIAVLWGDYLAANALCAVTSIRNPEVLRLLSRVQSDFGEAGFSCKVDKNGNMIPDATSPFSVWENTCIMEHASLLARGCEGMMVLAGHDNHFRRKAYDFGKFMALAMKVNQDIEDYHYLSTNCSTSVPFSLALAPVVLHLEDDKELLQMVTTNAGDDIMGLDFKQIHRALHEGRCIEKTQELLKLYIGQARMNLVFPESSFAKNILEDMLQTLER